MKKEKKNKKPINSIVLKSFISFFKSFKFVTIPMAFIYFGLLVLTLLSVQGLFNGITYFSTSSIQVLADAGSSASINVSELFNDTLAIDTNNFAESLQKVLKTFVDSIQGVGDEIIERLSNNAAQAVVILMRMVIIGLVILAITFIISSILTGIALRKDNDVKNNPGRFFLRSLLKTLVFALFIGLGALLFNIAPWAIPLLIIIYLFFSSYFLLIQGYMMNKGKQEAFKKIKASIYFKFLLINTLLYLMSLAIGGLLFLIIRDPIIALIVILPFIVYTNKFLDAYAEIYILNIFPNEAILL